MNNIFRQIRKKILRAVYLFSRRWGTNLVKNTLKPDDLEDFQSMIPFRPYEQMQYLSVDKAVEEAERILAEGLAAPKFPPINILEPIPWDAYQDTNRTWSYHLHSWDHLDILLSAYDQTKHLKYFKISLETILDWIDQFLVTNRNSEFAWYDMAVGLRSYRLAYILDAALRVGNISEETIANLILAVKYHLEYFSQDELISYHNNHGFYQAAGQMALSRRLQFLENREEISSQAVERFHIILSNQYSDEGIHLEHSPDYHRMVYQTLKGILDSGLIEEKSIIQKARLIETNLSRFILPNGNILEFGDGIQRNMFLSRKNAANWTTPEMRYMASKGQIGTPPSGQMAAFRESGYWTVIDHFPAEPENFEDNSYLAQQCGFHSRTHKHADDLTIIWYDRGQEILMDAGSYAYQGKTETGSDLWKDGFWYDDPKRVFVESTCAHNVVEIDGRNYLRRGVKPYRSALSKWGTIDSVHYAETNLYHFKTIRCTRVLFFKSREWLLVFDWLWDNKKQEHDFRQWFHLSEDFSVSRKQECFEAINPDRQQPSLKILPLINKPSFSEIYLGETVPQLQGWRSPGPSEFIPAPAFSFNHYGQPNATFATLLTFSEKLKTDQDSNRVATSGKKARFDWQSDTGTHTLLLDRTEEAQNYLTYNFMKSAPKQDESEENPG